MKEFLIVNIKSKFSSITENIITEKILKNYPYGSKIKDSSSMTFSFIITPYKIVSESDDFNSVKDFLYSIVSGNSIDDNIIYSVYDLLNKDGVDIIDDLSDISVDYVTKIDSNDIDIFYSDGSFNKTTGQSSYAVCKLLNESDDGTLDLFTESLYEYQVYSGAIDDSTNNVGELSGIKTATENFGNKKVQLIISDSIYSLKSFREWIYSWKNNNYRTYANKPIANEELIKETFNNIIKSPSIVVFKWTKGHKGDIFNEICDKEAKIAVGVNA